MVCAKSALFSFSHTFTTSGSQRRSRPIRMYAGAEPALIMSSNFLGEIRNKLATSQMVSSVSIFCACSCMVLHDARSSIDYGDVLKTANVKFTGRIHEQ